ncbi:hypothetical protein [Flavihumibacter solisilvae]|uniref:Uncharacterized protein n=1 Tax=Flavihumibacter solisilvae TaxID=1349421 RepID=A0A0C1IX58_9BACT|nr:hypothetical protein [Flavihumibacter solisilvae]KIC95009.1 hypothetical protein OI18_08990 [Flavihumibacter solisilvae]
MPVYFLHYLTPGRRERPEKGQLVKLHETDYNTFEGSEFLDDAIRNDEFELTTAEESAASGSPE